MNKAETLISKIDTIIEDKEVWDKKNPKEGHSKKLTPEQKAKAKARAKKEGRPWPNRVDTMWAAQQ